jgi:hypothetical protein
LVEKLDGGANLLLTDFDLGGNLPNDALHARGLFRGGAGGCLQ